MKVVPANAEEALSIAIELMPKGLKLEDANGKWRVERTSEGAWIVWIEGAAAKAFKMNHVKPHADTQRYESGEAAATAITYGWHTAYGMVL